VGETQVQAQTLLAGLAVVLRQQLKEAAHTLFNPAQSEQGDQGLGLAHATGHRPHKRDGEMGSAVDLLERNAEQIAVAEGGGFVEVAVGERLTKGFIGTGQSENQIITMLSDAAQLDHATGHEPDVIAQQRHAATSRHVHKVAALICIFQAGANTLLAVGSEDHRAVLRRLGDDCMERHRRWRQSSGSHSVKGCLASPGSMQDPYRPCLACRGHRMPTINLQTPQGCLQVLAACPTDQLPMRATAARALRSSSSRRGT
jgi:hypothetical protein